MISISQVDPSPDGLSCKMSSSPVSEMRTTLANSMPKDWKSWKWGYEDGQLEGMVRLDS
jgi:hypothetical protein